MELRISNFGDLGNNGGHQMKYPWEDYGVTSANGGSHGLVLKRSGGSYRTAFVEVFGGECPFIRGEGSTIEEAEESAWQKFQRVLECPGHEYDSRGYTNGAGFCRHCNAFKIDVFTPESLGQLCDECGAPTYDKAKDRFLCEEHHPSKSYRERLDALAAKKDLTDEEEEESWQLLKKMVEAIG